MIVPSGDAKRGRPTEGESVSERVVRDYVRRRILSPTYRDPETGRGGIYGYRHLIELLAARVLLADGWPLDLIADALKGKADSEIEEMLRPTQIDNEALQLARQFRKLDGGERRPPMSAAAPASIGSDALNLVPPKPSLSEVNDRLMRRSMLKSELPRLLDRIGAEPGRPIGKAMVSFDLAGDLVLLIGRERLVALTIEEAETIGRAVAGALLAHPNVPRPSNTEE